MRSFIVTAFIFLAAFGAVSAQTPVRNGLNRAYNIDAPAALVSGMSTPVQATALTDSPINMNILGAPSASGFPVVLIYDFATTLGNTIDVGAFFNFGFQFDIRDKHFDGYSEQIFIDGFANPQTYTMTNPSGHLNVTAFVTACNSSFAGGHCMDDSKYDNFEIGSQAIVFDPSATFSVLSTAAVQGSFDNGYHKFKLNEISGDGSKQFKFRQGFTFDFYGSTYTQASVSANGFVSFGGTDTSFPSPSVVTVRTGIPRIMSYYNDLVPEDMSYAPLTGIYAQQFTDVNGTRKVKFVHDHLAEFSDQTGPHGGECTISENGDIAIYVHAYQTDPSINTVVGITPGNGGPAVVGLGVDLTAASGTMLSLGAGGHGFEVFEYFPAATNPIDLHGFNFNMPEPGIVFMKDQTLANTNPFNSGYVIQ